MSNLIQSIIRDNTYAHAIHTLNSKLIELEKENKTIIQPAFTKNDGSKIYRPLTFKENIIARLNNNDLCDEYLDSCTGIAYKKNSSLIKIKQKREELILLPEHFDKTLVDINYALFEGEEIDAEKHGTKELWLFALGGNNKENEELHEIYSHKFKERPSMPQNSTRNFFILRQPLNDQLQALSLNFEDNCSYTNGCKPLNYNTHFLQEYQ